MEIVIPKRIKKKRHTHCNEYYHYEIEKIYPYHVVYKCVETGKMESFSKNNFITETADRVRKRVIKYKQVN